ncbi:MAG: hypothetical protein DHS20C14_19560 [Phycisphaeraceae bacterium]|nr:MAG: hypothetical protein DHS20C14_19560 [Phycisphaeraceae bacterium]
MSAAGAAAGPLATSHVPESAKWIAHVDLEAAAGTQLGRFALDMIAEETDGYEEIRQGLPGFTFAPEGGLHAITVFGRSFEEEGEDFVALLYGTEKIAGWGDQLDRKMREHGYEAPKMEIRGARVWMIPADEDEPMYAALTRHGDEHVWIVTRDASRAGKGVAFIRDGGRENGALEGLGWREGTIAIAAIKDPNEIEDFEEISHIVGDARSVVARVGEADGEVFVEGRVRTDSPEHAQRIARVADGLMALGSMMSGEDEELAHVMQLAREIRVQADGGTLMLSFTHDAGEVVEWVRESADVNIDVDDAWDLEDEGEDWDEDDDDFWGDDG